jgi:amidohydrolase
MTLNKIASFLSQHQEKYQKIRRHLHAHPEVAQEEHETASYIRDFLHNQTNAEVIPVGGTGTIAVFKGSAEGPSIMIRGDIDALPIQEINSFDHQSTVKGVSHKCGHDGHTTILLGLAELLSNFPIEKGQVALLFQPAEENGEGAKAVMADAAFQRLSFDFVFALHNLPGHEKGHIYFREGSFTANVKSIIIHFNGKTAHAAEPEKGMNPGLALAEILNFGEELTVNNPNVPQFFLSTPIFMQMGKKAYGISAGHGELHLTLRSWDPKLMEQNSDLFIEQIEQTARKYQLDHTIEWTQHFNANINDLDAVQYIRKAVKALSFEGHVLEAPFKWGEDFGLFTQQYKGAMFGIGAGIDCPALHNPDYDYPDEITGKAIQMFYQIILQATK